MPSASNGAGSVEVQAPPAPPGLESVNGCRGPSPLITSGSPAPGPIGPPKPEGLKEELVREVTSAVREHIEQKTTDAVDTLWQKGQRAMQNLQQQQLKQTAQLQSQLVACAEAHQQLQRENAMLRSGLEALMKHLTLVFGPPPHMVMPPATMPPGVPSGAPPPRTPTSAASAASASPFFPQTSASASPKTAPTTQCPQDAPASKTSGEPSIEDFHTPAGSPLRGAPSAAEELGAGPSPVPALAAVPPFSVAPGSSSGGTGADVASPPAAVLLPAGAVSAAISLPTEAVSTPTQALTFSLTLRRADNVPLGLDVIGEKDQEFLLVEGVRIGGAVEAWNRQCHGDAREIRKGDRIIMINGAKDAESMREECLKKHLLRMSVIRSPRNKASPLAAQGAGMRAEASEFVPKARPWLPGAAS